MARDGMIQVRIDSKLKQEAEALFNELGLDTASAIRMFLKQSVMYQGIPFAVVRQHPWKGAYYPDPTPAIPVEENTGSDALINDMDIDF